MSTTANHLAPSKTPPEGEPAVVATAGDQRLLTNFARSATCSATVHRPEDDRAWEQLFARPGRGGVTVRGRGASYSDAALNDGGIVAVTTVNSRIEGWDQQRGLLEVDAGLTLGQVLSFCVPLGWTLPVLPGTAQVTVGGAVAADVHGKNHARAGSFSACVSELVLITPGQGVLTVGPADQPEIFWATVGGLGLTGVVRRVRLQLTPISSSWLRTTDTACADLDEMLSVMADRTPRDEHVVGWVDAYAPVGSLGRGVVSTAEHCPGADLPPRLRRRAWRYQPRQLHLGIPATVNVVRPAVVGAANTARYHRARRRTDCRFSDFAHAFFPLDAVADWPVLYGKQGLVQYQFSVPNGQEHLLYRAIRFLPAAACPPALVTLKKLGPASPAPLSFPSPGWTMALDLPAGPARAAAKALDRLDEDVANAGGRIYLVKNGHTRPDLISRMYPQLQRWQVVREQLDPEGVMTSALDRRLDLTKQHRGER